MGRSYVSESEVFEAARELVSRGEQPTTLKLHQVIGRGSYTTLSKYLKIWEASPEAIEAKADQLPAEIEVPAELMEDTVTLAKKVWTAAKNKADETLEIERKALAEAQKKYDLEVEQAVNMSDMAIAKSEELEGRLGDAEAERDALLSDVDRLKQELEGFQVLRDAHEKMKAENAVLGKKLVELETRLSVADEQMTKQDKGHAEEVARLEKQHERAFAAIEKLKK
ncbi:MAG: DNA-binding protein [Pseudomonadales bacterium]|nr:DNA-binding protein [Pseudomonadales bacterium]